MINLCDECLRCPDREGKLSNCWHNCTYPEDILEAMSDKRNAAQVFDEFFRKKMMEEQADE